MHTLIIIPARAGSKGLPGKNVKLLGSKPLIAYSLEFAKEICGPDDVICVSTNDDEALLVAAHYGIEVSFKRPEYLATDEVGTYDVIKHALTHYADLGQIFDRVLLLQPTSPFRSKKDYEAMVSIYNEKCDMVVTVKHSKENPYFTLFEEVDGYLQISKQANYETRQNCPPVYAYNGSMYLISVSALKRSKLSGFKTVRKLLVSKERSVDIDTMEDWIIAEYYLQQKQKLE